MINDDVYFSAPPYPQGEPDFVDDLRKFRVVKAHWDGAPNADELAISSGFKVIVELDDPENLLETAIATLKRFAADNDLPEDGAVSVILREDSSLSSESYRREITTESVTIHAGGIEGARRALYHLIDDCAATEHPSLPLGKIARDCWLKNRIARSFFAPIKRPPFNQDELMDDIDYYPEGLLDRLASEGVNGLWLTVVWREIARTDFLPEDPDREKRLQKLRKVVTKCRRYGIKVWIFCIEPRAWNHANPLPEKYPELAATSPHNGEIAFCVKSESAKQYLRESAKSVFSEVKNLGGIMMISLGERLTTCLPCEPKCRENCGLSKAEVFAATINSIRDGVVAANPDAEVLSWLYQPQCWDIPDFICTLPTRLVGDHITMAYNFESGCMKTQAGKVHTGGDYWLSNVGPANAFRSFAAAANGHCEVAAKIQVGCSHECATVPFIPVPGQLYHKFRKMREMGVTSVLQCWYFGAFPGVMNKAAGLLAYEDFRGDEQSFLRKLAAADWGDKNAEIMAKAYLNFGKAYENYPLDNQMQYYGPMHDGAVWLLSLRCEHRKLTRTWKPEKFAAGDAVGEMTGAFTLPEIECLTRELARQWHTATGSIRGLEAEYKCAGERKLDFSIYKALDLLFSSGADIIRFYRLRNEWLHAPEKFAGNLAEMKKIVGDEIRRSEELAELCEKDSRLGFHPEAGVFKFFPKKLRWRGEQLRNLLDTDFARAEKSADMGYFRNEPRVASAGELDGGNFRFKIKYDPLDNMVKLRILSVAPAPEKTLDDKFVLALTDAYHETMPRLLEFSSEVGDYEFPAALQSNHDGKIAFSLTRMCDGDFAEMLVNSYPPAARRCDLRLKLHFVEPEVMMLLPIDEEK